MTREIDRRTRRIPDAVSKTVWQHLDAEYIQARADKDMNRASEIRLYKVGHSTRKYLNTETNTMYSPVTYAAFPKACELLGKTAKELFAEAKVRIGWPSERVKSVYEMLKTTDDTFQNRVETCISALTHDDWKASDDTQVSEPSIPAVRVAQVLEHHARWANEKKKFYEEELNITTSLSATLPNYNVRIAGMNFDHVCRASKSLEISLTWLMGLVDGKSVLLADSAKLEYIMAGFCFLSETDKRAVTQFIRAGCGGS